MRLLTLGLTAFLAAASGCGSRPGGLAGAVSYKGRPLTSGTVVLIGSDGVPRYSLVGPDGSYCFDSVPAGPARLGVVSPNPVEHERRLASVARGRAGAQPAVAPTASTGGGGSEWFPVPGRYSDPENSGLSCELRRGTNTFPINLTD